MTAVARGTETRIKNVTPVGYEYYDRGRATQDIKCGELVKIVPTGVSLNPAGGVSPSGMCLIGAKSGNIVEFGRQCEIDGFSAMTVGARLYPSPSVAGGLDDASLVGAVPFIEAITATRVYFRA